MATSNINFTITKPSLTIINGPRDAWQLSLATNREDKLEP